MIGKEILNYTIVSLIGKGGMGSVYLAEHKYIKQQKVAIKVINGNMTNDFTRKKLTEEADRLARMNHPNIVHFVNYHIDEAGNIYLVMEYAEGRSLEDHIKNVSGLIVEENICSFFEPLLDAFDYAHKHHIIHKDIKPSNIIITTEGTPKILDFGIAALLDEGNDSEDKDVIMGTPSYMSPEQIKGENLDQRSDIYSLGVLLHQMLTGNPPYDTTTLTEHEIYKHVMEDELPRMKTYYKYVSDKVQAIVDKATSKKKEMRYQSCQDFKKALHAAVNPSALSKGMKAMIGAAVAAVLLGVFFIWDYSRVKVTYYKDYVEQWGVPQGIGKISKSDRQHVHRMYRFESKNYKLRRVSHVNSLGTVIEDMESERYDRPLDVLFYYNDDNRLTRAEVMDNNGQIIYVKSYNEKLNTVIFQFDDEYGTEKTIGNETVGHVDVFDNDQNKGRISRYLLEYDEDGYVTTLRYAGFQNIYVCDAQGIYGKKYVRDEKGRVIEEMYLSHDGTPKATNWGLGKKIFVYDEEDNWVKSLYQTVDGEPSLDASDGTEVCENVYDKYGNEISQYYKTADGQLMLPKNYESSGVHTEYDENGFICKRSYIGIDGNVEYSPAQGAAVQVMECNEYGFFSKVSYMDAEGNPCVTEDGNAYVRSVTDARGNMLESWNYDLTDSLVLNPEGYAGVKAEYDSLGHMTKVVFYGVDGEPCELQSGIAGWTREYNDMGYCVKETNIGIDQELTLSNNDICTSVYERDVRGNITKISYFDVEGNATLSGEDISVIEYTYDENGNMTEMRFLDTEGKLTKGTLGYAKNVYTYDENGHLLTQRYYGLNDKLILVDDIAGENYKRDARGNIIEEYSVGTDSKLARGYLVVRRKFDEKDNMIEFAVFDADGRPETNSNDIHKYTQKFNSRNQCVETCYYNTNGSLTTYAGNTYCIVRMEYNERGLNTKVSYFDKNDSPVEYRGSEGRYASLVSEFDMYGRVVRQLYYDKNGALTAPDVMVPEALVQYDKWGNIVYFASADGNGNLIPNPKKGWTISKSEYDSKSNMMWQAYFDEKDQPKSCKDGYHKVVYAYTKTNEQESEAYFDVKGNPALVNGYHKEVYTYDENDNCIEIAYFGKTGNAVNSSYGFYKVVFTYNADQTIRDRKYYNAAGRMLLHEQYINGSWIEVKYWQKDFTDFASSLPENLGRDFDYIVIQSARVVNANRGEYVMVVPKSKYEMTNSALNTYIEFLDVFTSYLKANIGLPSSVTLRGILKDNKGRVLSTVNK